MTRLWTDESARAFLEEVFQTALQSVDPKPQVLRHMPQKPKGRCVVVGAGKASAVMAAAVEEAWPDVELSGVVVTRYGQVVPAGRIEIVEAAHPVPDEGSLRAGEVILEAVRGLSSEDLVLALISGGGSSLLVSPVEGVTLADKSALNKALLQSGATINEMNVIRAAFSNIKGGGLARAAAPARIVSLIISDVPGDNPAAVASGPTVSSILNRDYVEDIIARYQLKLPNSVQQALANRVFIDEANVRGEVHVIASAQIALKAAAEFAASQGVTPLILGDALEGESAELGIISAGIARSIQTDITTIPRPALILSGGETTVSIRDGKAGRGGRNTEFALSLAIKLGCLDGIWAIACDTDGIDGTDDAAGAFISPTTLQRSRDEGLKPNDFLRDHDSYTFFDALGDLIRTGPTHTNVNDFRAILVE